MSRFEENTKVAKPIFNKYGPKKGAPEYLEVDENEEIEMLTKRIIAEAPAPGSQLRSEGVMKFESMPLSAKTRYSLKVAKLEIATEIQAAAIPHALAGRDILGAAKTGSGKTLSFVIPLIERLYTEKWSVDDGLAAIVITPTRELALQIFEVVRVVGKLHQLSAGLVTGGRKEFEGEQDRIVKMNILVATPGRLLQHFETTNGFDASQLLLLVLDEADRILDMGFRTQLDGILQYLPPRQTMLFSATQTKSVKDLARLSLNSPQYVAVHALDKEVTPKQLLQNYVTVRLPDKLDVLYSFIKSHLKNKMIVFFATCSQVRFVFELFRGMQPGMPLTALHGKIKQDRRTMVFQDFIRRKAACMFATDIASRGLDFPDIDWVVQVDAPEDTNMYIHRVGRTARYNAGGRALLMLLPTEEQTVTKNLLDAGVPIKRLTVNPNRAVSVGSVAAGYLVAHPDCRGLAKKSFCGYLRSLQLLPGKSQQDISKLPLDAFAVSLGLGMTPDAPVAPQGSEEREDVREKKNVNRALDKLKKQIKAAKEEKKRLRELAALGIDPSTVPKKEKDDDSDSDGEDFLTVKKVHEWATTQTPSASTETKKKSKKIGEDSDDESSALAAAKTEKSKKQKALKIKLDGVSKASKDAGAKKIIYDDDGNEVEAVKLIPSKISVDSSGRLIGVAAKMEEHTKRVRQLVDQGRVADRERDAERVREKRRERKMKYEKNGKEKVEEEGRVAVLSGGGDEEEGEKFYGINSEDEDETGGNEDEGSVDEYGNNKYVKGRYCGNDDDSDDNRHSRIVNDESDEEEEEEEEVVRKPIKKVRAGKKKNDLKRGRAQEDSDNASDNDDGGDVLGQEEMEEMALKMLRTA